MVDQMFGVSQLIKIEDKSVVFHAFSLFDRFYKKHYLNTQQKFESDFMLTAFVCLFSSSKNMEVEPLNLKDIKNSLLQRKFTPE